MFIQVFRLLKDSMKVCEFCEQNAGLFKGCKYLNLINEEDFSELICENCVYADNCSCTVEAGE